MLKANVNRKKNENNIDKYEREERSQSKNNKRGKKDNESNKKEGEFWWNFEMKEEKERKVEDWM